MLSTIIILHNFFLCALRASLMAFAMLFVMTVFTIIL